MLGLSIGVFPDDGDVGVGLRVRDNDALGVRASYAARCDRSGVRFDVRV